MSRFSPWSGSFWAGRRVASRGARWGRRPARRWSPCGSRTHRRGKTPLLYAAAASESELVRALVEAGADIDFRDRSGATPTWYAAGFGDFAATRTLVEAGAQLDITGNCYKWGKQECTAAEVARFKQFYDIAKYLEEKAAAKGTEVAPAASGEAKP